jgi:hypothetical protein
MCTYHENIIFLFSSPTLSTGDRHPYTINAIITSPNKTSGIHADTNVSNHCQRRTTSNIISPVSNILNTNGDLIIQTNGDSNSSRHTHKRRSVSAATTSTTTYLSATEKNTRAARTNSSSAVPMRSKSSNNITNSKRCHSPSTVPLLVSNKNSHQRKKQKFSHYWVLFGKSQRKLVSIDVSRKQITIESNHLLFVRIFHKG